MGWKPTDGLGDDGEQEEKPAPRRRRRVPRAAPVEEEKPKRKRYGHTPAEKKEFEGADAFMGGRDERTVTTRPAPGLKGKENDPRPRGMSVNVGKRWSQIIWEVRKGKYTWQQFCESLSSEELARGHLRDSKGTFTGRPPTLVPREFHLTCFRELKRRFDEEFQKGVLDIAKEFVVLAQDKGLPVQTRAKMMQYAMERVFGGIPKEVLVKQDAPWEAVFTTIVDGDDDPEPEWRKGRYDQFTDEDDPDDEPDEEDEGLEP